MLLGVSEVIGNAREEVLVLLARKQVAVFQRFLAEFGQQRVAALVDLHVEPAIEHHRSEDEAVRGVIADGYDVPVPRGVPLAVARWTELAGIWLRFDHDVHEGSASFENHGSLRLSCAAPAGPESGRLVVENNQAEAAIGFSVEHERVIAVGFVEADGGEGAAYFNTAYERLDIEQMCGATAPSQHAR